MAAHWYCLIGQQQYGPFTSEQIQQLAAQGQLQREHYVRTETDSQWTAAGDLPGLFPAPQAAPVQSPAPSVTSRPKKKRVAPPGSSATPPAAASSPPPVVPTVPQPRPATPTAPAGRTGPIPAAPAPAAPVGMPIAAMPVAAAPPVAAAVPAMAASAVPAARTGGKPAAVARPIPLHPGAPPARPAEPAAPARDEGGTGRRPRGSRQKSQLVVGGLVAAMVLLIVIAVVVVNRGPGKKTTARPGRATASAQGGGAASNSNPESDPVAVVTPSKEPGTIADPPQATPTSVKEAAAGPKSSSMPAVDKWLDAARQKRVIRDVARLGVNKAWLDEGDGKAMILNIEIQMTNLSPDEPLEFSGWRPDNQPQPEARACLYDEAGVALRTAPERKTPASPASVRRAARRWINPGESTTEQLAFVFPGDESKLFRLALPYAAIGQTGYLGFELPRQMIKQGTPDAKEAAGPKAAEPAAETLLPAGEMVKPKPGEPDTIRDLKSEIERSGEAKTEAMKETPEPAADEHPKPEKEPEPEKKPDLRKFIEEEDQKAEAKGKEPPSDGMQEEPKSP